jgi:hypothetical protein
MKKMIHMNPHLDVDPTLNSPLQEEMTQMEKAGILMPMVGPRDSARGVEVSVLVDFVEICC